ncbi:MAG: hypothetical protein K6T59_10860, partial [Bryobacteraceae bacterium]|nr:hypothetical protein [Bryobacteraceae bacterium]
VCTLCQFVWTDAGELEQMPLAPPHVRPPEPDLPQEAKEAQAIAKVQALAEQARRYDYQECRTIFFKPRSSFWGCRWKRKITCSTTPG